MTIALSGISGIGPNTAKVLMENGFKSANDIAQATIAQLIGVPGFSTARASRTIKAANELFCASADAAAPADTVQSTTQPAPRQQQTAKKPVPKSPSDSTADNDTKETEIKDMTENEPEELGKTKVKEAKKAEKAEKAAAKKAKKAEKAAAKKAKKAEKAAAKKAKKAKKAAAKKAKKAKKAAAKKAKKAKKAKSGAKKSGK